MNFDFDEWALLAKQDNVAFEEKRAAALKQFIDSLASNDNDLRRLNGLQFQIDMIRRKHKSPMGACIAISEIMMDKLYELVTIDIDEIILDAEKQRDKMIATDNVVPFHASTKHETNETQQK